MASPARLDHAGDFTTEGEHAKTDAAKLELAVITASAAANLATVTVPHLELRGAIELRKLRCTRHLFLCVSLLREL